MIALARSAKTEVPAHPSVKGMVDTFHFKTRVNLKDPIVAAVFETKLLSRAHAQLRQALRRIA